MKNILVIFPLIMASFAFVACRDNEVQSSANDSLAGMYTGNEKPQQVPQETVDRNHQALQDIERERREEDLRRRCGSACDGFGIMAQNSSTTEVLARKLSQQEQISTASARILVGALADLSLGDMSALARIGITKNALARVASGGGTFSRAELAQISQRTGLTPRQATQIMQRFVK